MGNWLILVSTLASTRAIIYSQAGTTHQVIHSGIRLLYASGSRYGENLELVVRDLRVVLLQAFSAITFPILFFYTVSFW